jgi:translocation and assembly module TamA
MRARILAVFCPLRCVLRYGISGLLCVALPCVVLSRDISLAANDLDYEVTFSGAPDTVVAGLVKRVSKLQREKRNGAANAVALDRRAARDAKRFLEVLHSEGYYDAMVDYRIDTSRSPAAVDVRLDAGARYTISEFAVRLTGAVVDEAAIAAELERVRSMSGGPARAQDVLDAEAALVKGVVARGYPLARVVEQRYVVDHAVDALRVDVALDTGAAAKFGKISFDGLVDVHASYVRNRLPWKDGDPYDPAKVERGRREIVSTGLFAHARIDHAGYVEADGTLPMTVTVAEGKFRTIGLGVRYDSTLGAGGGASWEHRNVLGGGERFRISGDVAESGYAAGLLWREPDFLRPGYTLSYSAGYETEETTAYDIQRAYTAVGLEVPFGDTVVTTGGVTLEWTPVETKARDADTGERDQDDTFLLLGFPLSVIRSTTDSILEPTRGTRVELSVTPYTDIGGKDLAFAVIRTTPSLYIPFDPPLLRRSVLATRLSVGTINGAKRGQVPADKRFYAGGGGSIRGYEYQRVGPLDDDDEPLGGRSLLEVGTELRLRITEAFGIVGFFEGGNVYTSLYPDFDDVIRWGAGGGIRYYSPVGPFRLDIGTPVNGRDGIDDAVQFYISLGEAF